MGGGRKEAEYQHAQRTEAQGGKGKQPQPPPPASAHARVDDDSASEAQVEQYLEQYFGAYVDEDYVFGQGWDNPNDGNTSLNGTRQKSQTVPRNAIPGPSNV